jgi:FAD/FMN-containing dehydrogenase
LTALLAVPDPAAAVQLLARLRAACGERVSAFEIISRLCFDLVLKHIPGTREPLAQPHPWHVLTELTDTSEAGSLREDFERTVAQAGEEGLVGDAVLAETTAQAQALWRMRETIPEASRDEGLLYRHDISLAVSRIPEFIATAGAALERRWPGVRIICFGHVGDGNLHYNCFVPGRGRDDPAARDADDVNHVVLDIVVAAGGSFSAEHGIGQAKRGALARYKSVMELGMMRALKQAFDPGNIMNPGKVLPDDVPA